MILLSSCEKTLWRHLLGFGHNSSHGVVHAGRRLSLAGLAPFHTCPASPHPASACRISAQQQCPVSVSVQSRPLRSSSPQRKSFASALCNSCVLPRPCFKGDEISITIPEDEYQAGLQRCKNHLHGRLILSKGNSHYKFADLRNKLSNLWKPIGDWSIISLGKRYFDFSFASQGDLNSVCSKGSWSLKPGFLRISLWKPDFNPLLQKQSHTESWVRIFGLTQDYWSTKIIFVIAGGIGTPLALDEATGKRAFGQFARVLVDIYLNTDLRDKILVEREGYGFFVGLEYENLPLFCVGCQLTGQTVATCKQLSKDDAYKKEKVVPIPRAFPTPRKTTTKYVPKGKNFTNLEEGIITVERLHIDKSALVGVNNIASNGAAQSNPLMGFVTGKSVLEHTSSSPASGENLVQHCEMGIQHSGTDLDEQNLNNDVEQAIHDVLAQVT